MKILAFGWSATKNNLITEELPEIVKDLYPPLDTL